MILRQRHAEDTSECSAREIAATPEASLILFFILRQSCRVGSPRAKMCATRDGPRRTQATGAAYTSQSRELSPCEHPLNLYKPVETDVSAPRSRAIKNLGLQVVP
jgi:hypothetical protein